MRAIRPIRAPAKAAATGLLEPALLGAGVVLGIGVTSGVDPPEVASGLLEDGLEGTIVVGTGTTGTTGTVCSGTVGLGTVGCGTVVRVWMLVSAAWEVRDWMVVSAAWEVRVWMLVSAEWEVRV